MTYSPVQISKTIDDTGKYEFGKSYRDYANTLPPLNEQRKQFGTSPYKVELDSSESDNNSPIQPISDQSHLINKRGQNSSNLVKFQFDERFENEINGKFVCNLFRI